MNTSTLLISMLFVPAIMLVFGIAMLRVPDRNTGSFLGFRTKRATKNDNTWIFANKHGGKIITIVGGVVFVISAVLCIPFWNSDKDTIELLSIIAEGVQVALFILSFVPTNLALKKKFDDKGNEIQK